MNSQRGQAVLISLRRRSPTCRGQNLPVEGFEAEKAIAPGQWQECRVSTRRKILPSLPIGALAQLGERLICIQEVRSSILLGSTKQGSRYPRGMAARHMPQNDPLDRFGAKRTACGSVAQVVRAHA
jgi:hypothetical protein